MKKRISSHNVLILLVLGLAGMNVLRYKEAALRTSKEFWKNLDRDLLE
jgi:hypothetical protein